jgi:hypothetical protein
MSLPTPLRINTTDLLRATSRGLRLLLDVCLPAGTQEAAPQPRPQRKPGTNQRRREGR